MHAQRIRRIIPLILLVVVVTAAAVYLSSVAGKEPEGLRASGTVEAVEVLIAPTAAGRIAEVMAGEGDQVTAGQALFRLEDDLMQAQRQRAVSALEAARAQVDVARAGVATADAGRDTALTGQAAAQVQYEAALFNAQQSEQPARTATWSQPALALPNYYFTRQEALAAADAELAAAEADLTSAEAAVTELTTSGDLAELMAAEARLAAAQTRFLTGQSILALAQEQGDATLLVAAQDNLEAAQTELEEAREAYEELLDEDEAADLRIARAELAVAQERVDAAADRRRPLLTGLDSLAVRAAEVVLEQAGAVVAQAEAAVTQAQAGQTAAEKLVAQVQAELELVDVQLEQLFVRAPVDGVIMSRAVEPGELVQPGTVAMVLGRLDHLTITVYLPEDRYGEVGLNQTASVTVDSFPGKTFTARIVRVADQAEFTPRNVQTVEGRRSTVFAIILSVDDPAGNLKPGMPADVDFES
jgi:HlyD family secretion protein